MRVCVYMCASECMCERVSEVLSLNSPTVHTQPQLWDVRNNIYCAQTFSPYFGEASVTLTSVP